MTSLVEEVSVRCNKSEILQIALYVASSCCNVGKVVFGGCFRRLTMSVAAWRKKVSIVMVGKGTLCGRKVSVSMTRSDLVCGK